MPEVISKPALAHVVFLERAAQEEDSARARFGQAAFLVLRLVDLIASSSESEDDLFGYQAAATSRYCADQLAAGPGRDQLLRVVVGATRAQHFRTPESLAAEMLDLAGFLMEQSEHEGALDVLATLATVAGERLGPSEAIRAALLQGRIERELARFDSAMRAYERADRLARAIEDTRSVLRSRLGRANLFWSRGNLAEAERWNREALCDARAAGERDAEARATHGLGVVLGARGQVPDAIPLLWSAYLLSQDAASSRRVMTDLGYALSRLGEMDGAERAFRVVLGVAGTADGTHNALVELMHCASFRRDRIAFERWRSKCEDVKAAMTPNTLTDYHLKVGVGLARFEQWERARAELEFGLRLACDKGLHEFEFRIERILAGLGGPCVEYARDESAFAEPAWTAAVDLVSAALAELQLV